MGVDVLAAPLKGPRVVAVAALWTALASAGWTESGRPEIDPLPKVRRFADNLIEHTQDKYGPKHTPLFVCQLDIDKKTLPPADTRLYASSRRGGAGPLMNKMTMAAEIPARRPPPENDPLVI